MPNWEDELEHLLSDLGVSLEPITISAETAPINGFLARGATDEEDEQSVLVNSEVAATIREVSRLAEEGTLDLAVRDDVLRVLRTLTRPSPIAGTEGEEWDFGSAVAVLHFCRIVQRMTHAISHLHRG